MLYDIQDDHYQQRNRKHKKGFSKGALAVQYIHRTIKDRRVIRTLATCKISHSCTDKHDDQTRQFRRNRIAAQFK